MSAFFKSNIAFILESVMLLVIGFAYWYATPIRDQWIWLLGLLIPIYTLNMSKSVNAHQTLIKIGWTYRLYLPIVVFLLLCFVNISFAPYESRGLILIFRPLYGAALVVYGVHYAAQRLPPRYLLQFVAIGGLLLSIVALTATNWQTIQGKLGILSRVVVMFPVIRSYPDASGLFNPNEIAGAMTWLAPMMLGLIFTYQRFQARVWMSLAVLAACLLYVALVFGLSMSGLAGVFAGAAIVLCGQVRVLKPIWGKFVAMCVVGVIVAHGMIFVNPSFVSQTLNTLTQRTDSQSLLHREVIWTSARQAILDYPMTGIGMAVYRSQQAWEAYPTPGFNRQDAVHAHNELLHIGTDLGVPGMIALIALYGMAGYMLGVVYRNSNIELQGYVVAITAGMIAHAIYGLADAIPLWDRFAYLFWLMLALCAMLYTHVRLEIQDKRGAAAELAR